MGSKRVVFADIVRGLNTTPNFLITGDAEPGSSPIGGILAYSDAAASSPVDGSGGSPASTIAVSADTSLIGTSNYLWTKSAANRQGEGWAIPFSIDSAYQSKPMTISALYRVDSGTYADNDMSVWVYDVTNAVLIQPSAYQIKNATGVEQLKCEFQAASNSTSYRLIFHTASTSASAYTLRFDALSISPNTYTSGPIITDWVAYTPTYTGVGTVTGNVTQYRRVGSNLEVTGGYTAGTTTGTTYSITLPSGLTVDHSKLNGSGVTALVGQQHNMTSSLTGIYPTEMGTLFTDGTNNFIYFGHQSQTKTYVFGTGANAANSTDVVRYNFTVPISGWGTAQVLSSDTDTRVVAAIIGGTPPSTVSANAIVIYPTVVKDTHGAYSTSTGEYTVPVSGYYAVSAAANTNASTNVLMYAYVDAVKQQPSICSANSAGIFSGGRTTVYATAGQKITVRPGAGWSAVGADPSGLTIERISGPAQIAASEKITAVYTLSANTTPGAGNPLIFNTKVIDSHGAYSTSTGRFTAPSARNYMVNTSIAYNATAGYLVLYKNGVAYQDVAYSGTGAGQSYLSTNTIVIPLIAGDYIECRAAGSTQFGGGAHGSGLAQITSIAITSQG